MEKNINNNYNYNRKPYIARPKNERGENQEHNIPGKKLFIAYPKSKIPPPFEHGQDETLRREETLFVAYPKQHVQVNTAANIYGRNVTDKIKTGYVALPNKARLSITKKYMLKEPMAKLKQHVAFTHILQFLKLKVS